MSFSDEDYEEWLQRASEDAWEKALNAERKLGADEAKAEIVRKLREQADLLSGKGLSEAYYWKAIADFIEKLGCP